MNTEFSPWFGAESSFNWQNLYNAAVNGTTNAMISFRTLLPDAQSANFLQGKVCSVGYRPLYSLKRLFISNCASLQQDIEPWVRGDYAHPITVPKEDEVFDQEYDLELDKKLRDYSHQEWLKPSAIGDLLKSKLCSVHYGPEYQPNRHILMQDCHTIHKSIEPWVEENYELKEHLFDSHEQFTNFKNKLIRALHFHADKSIKEKMDEFTELELDEFQTNLITELQEQLKEQAREKVAALSDREWLEQLAKSAWRETNEAIEPLTQQLSQAKSFLEKFIQEQLDKTEMDETVASLYQQACYQTGLLLGNNGESKEEITQKGHVILASSTGLLIGSYVLYRIFNSESGKEATNAIGDAFDFTIEAEEEHPLLKDMNAPVSRPSFFSILKDFLPHVGPRVEDEAHNPSRGLTAKSKERQQAKPLTFPPKEAQSTAAAAGNQGVELSSARSLHAFFSQPEETTGSQDTPLQTKDEIIASLNVLKAKVCESTLPDEKKELLSQRITVLLGALRALSNEQVLNSDFSVQRVKIDELSTRITAILNANAHSLEEAPPLRSAL